MPRLIEIIKCQICNQGTYADRECHICNPKKEDFDIADFMSPQLRINQAYRLKKND